MTDADPLFPGFTTDTFHTDGAEIFYRTGGAGPPLLLLHGFPQTGAMWARSAQLLAQNFRVVVPDLRGYGRSSGPVGEAFYTKRVMGRDFGALMTSLGFETFNIAGHDRGGRVAYRLALDAPERIEKIAVLDILPTIEYWRSFASRSFAVGIYHWGFLAQPYPLPERLISGAPEFYIDQKLKDWSGGDDLSPYDPAALEEYRAAARDPATLRAMCDDYRAGAGVDAEHDEADEAAGRKITAPLQVLWGAKGIAQKSQGPLAVWRRWAETVSDLPMNSGHFIPEEQPEETAKALASFFTKTV
ncbi:MAG: alpha/beta hydrolase [Pseudomonadota bacterium]